MPPPPYPHMILRAPGSSAELRAVLGIALREDIAVRTLAWPAAAGVTAERTEAPLGYDPHAALPVGSVEFVLEVMRAAGVQAPAPMSYPVELFPLLGRNVASTTLGAVRGAPKQDVFIKPQSIKTFNGFVWRPGATDIDEHDQEQLALMARLPDEFPVWVCEPIEFLCEWRYYVRHGYIVGASRYDPDGAESAPTPSVRTVMDAVERMSLSSSDSGSSRSSPPAGYALDFGVTKNGRTLLVEANDGWALGYYGTGIAAVDYLKLLWARWQQIASATSP